MIAIAISYVVVRIAPAEPSTIKVESVPAYPPQPQPQPQPREITSSAPPKDAGILKYVRAPRGSEAGNVWSVLMYDKDGNPYPILRSTAQTAMQIAGYKTPAIFQSPLPASTFAELFNADLPTIFQLRHYCAGLVLGMITSATEPDDQYKGLYTTHLRTDVKLISTSERIRREFNLEQDGAGMDADSSRSNAEERLAERLKSEIEKSVAK